MTIKLQHYTITSLVLEGVHNRLSLFKVLTQAMGTQDAQPTTDKPIINNYHRLCKPRVETSQQYRGSECVLCHTAKHTIKYTFLQEAKAEWLLVTVVSLRCITECTY